MKLSVCKLAAKALFTECPFDGCLVLENGSPLGEVSYRNGGGKAVLCITVNDDVAEMSADADFLMGSCGSIRINGEIFGTFESTHCRLRIVDAFGQEMLRAEDDSSERRFLWAYRQELSKQEADLYAQSCFALWVGRGYALASLFSGSFKPLCLPWRRVYPVMNADDEAFYLAQDTATRMCLLIAACWWACDSLHHVKCIHAYKDATSLPSIPSMLKRNGQKVILPDALPPRRGCVEFSRKHPLIVWLWLLGALLTPLLILPLYQQRFTGEHILMTVQLSAVPIVWIVVDFLLTRRAGKRICDIARQMEQG